MAAVEIRNELLYRAPTRVGLLADVAEALRRADVNIHAIGAYDKGDVGEFLMLTSNNRAAGEALTALGGELDMVSVVVVEVPNTPGELAYLARKIADAGINVSQIHATTTDAPTAMIVVRTDQEVPLVELLETL